MKWLGYLAVTICVVLCLHAGYNRWTAPPMTEAERLTQSAAEGLVAAFFGYGGLYLLRAADEEERRKR